MQAAVEAVLRAFGSMSDARMGAGGREPQATIGVEPMEHEVGWQEEEEVGKRNRDWEGYAKATLTENLSENEKL
eukprot:1490950-Rhodomonas_salina.2